MMCIVKIMLYNATFRLCLSYFCFVFHTEESHFALTKGVNTVTLYGWKYRHYFICRYDCNCKFNFAEVVLKFCNLRDTCMHDCVK